MRVSRLASVLLAVSSIVLGPLTASAAEPTHIQSFQLVAQKSGWLLASNRLFFTSTLGAQWTEITPTPSTSLSGVYFRPDGQGWVVASSATALTLAHTIDNGAHWTTSALPAKLTPAQTLSGQASTYFPDANHGFVLLGLQSGSAFRPGILLRTTDGGLTFTQAPAPPIGGDLTFLDATHGFLAHGPAGDELYRTADAGNTWQPLTLTAPAAFAAATSTIAQPAFTNATHGALLRTFNTSTGAFTARYETTDAGITWTPSNSVPSAAATLTQDAAATKLISASPTVAGLPATIGTLIPTRSSFSTATTGWVLFSSGSCSSGICVQTAALRATTDGGQSYVALAQISGLNLESTTAAPSNIPSTLASANSAHPDSTSVYNTNGVMGFDACSLPTTPQLTDWSINSPYRVVGVYIGGANFACRSGLGGLTTSYVSSLLTLGYQMIPIWVGPQAPGSGCTSCSMFSATPATAQAAGATEADSAVAAMQGVSLGQGSIIIYDMEAYDRTTASNVAATSAFIEGWNTELHNMGYTAAVYSGHSEFTDWYPGVVTPAIDSIWFTYFFSSGVACGTTCQTVFPTQSSFDISTSYWLNNHRSRQTSSAFNSTYGTTTINIDEDWVDAAMVTATPNLLTVTKTGSGSVASNTITNTNGDSTAYTAISCGNTCTANFAPTDTVTLTATAATGSVFSSWTGCDTTSGATCTIAVTSAKTITASFVVNNSLTVTKSGTGTGTVTSADNNINCGTTCSYTYTTSTPVVLTATPTSPSVFGAWTGCTTTTGTTCNVTVNGGAAVTASFYAPALLTVAKSGTGSGTVTSADNNINCGTACTFTYPYNTAVTLTAAAAAGSTFTGWSGGGCSGTSTCVTTLAAATTVTAAFTGPLTLTVSKAGTGTGTVTSTSPDTQINCGTTCSGTYAYNTIVVLSASANAGSAFTGWSGGGCSGTATCSVTLTAATTVTSTFTLGSVSAVPSATSLTVTKGTTGTVNIGITTANNWTGTVSGFTCSGLYSTVSCAFAPTSLTFTSNTMQQTILTITVPSTISQFKIGTASNIVFAGLILPAILLPLAFRRRRNAMRGMLMAVFALATLGAAQVLTGCGGSSSPAAPSGNIFSGAITVNYTATPTSGAATNGSSSFTLTIPRT